MNYNMISHEAVHQNCAGYSDHGEDGNYCICLFMIVVIVICYCSCHLDGGSMVRMVMRAIRLVMYYEFQQSGSGFGSSAAWIAGIWPPH